MHASIDCWYGRGRFSRVVEIFGEQILQPQFRSPDGNSKSTNSNMRKWSAMASSAKASRIALQRLCEVAGFAFHGNHSNFNFWKFEVTFLLLYKENGSFLSLACCQSSIISVLKLAAPGADRENLVFPPGDISPSLLSGWNILEYSALKMEYFAWLSSIHTALVSSL